MARTSWRFAARFGNHGYRLVAVFLIIFAIIAPMNRAAAQSATDGWTTRSTDFATLSFSPDLPELPDLAPDLLVANFGAEIDAATSELSLVLDVQPGPIDILIVPRLVNTDGAWFDAISGAIIFDGPALTGKTTIDAINLIRHAVATRIAYEASSGSIAPLFLAGIAMYAERPLTPVLSRYAADLQNANSQGSLLSWADLGRSASGETERTDVAAASHYAVTAWLIDHFQIAPYQEFLRNMGELGDWRAALEATYGMPAADIERQWRDELPRWTNSGWKTNVIAGFDLDPARTLLENGNYAAAKASLERSQRLFSELGDDEHLQVVTALLAQTEVGLQAEALMSQTEIALKQHDYERASDLIAQAEAQYARMPPDQRPEAVLADYRARSDAGLEAIQRLQEAKELAGSWTEFPQARSDALAAGRTFAELGDTTRLTEAEQTLDRIDERVRRLVFLLGGLAFLSFVWLLLWRRHGSNMLLVWPEQIRPNVDSRGGD